MLHQQHKASSPPKVYLSLILSATWVSGITTSVPRQRTRIDLEHANQAGKIDPMS